MTVLKEDIYDDESIWGGNSSEEGMFRNPLNYWCGNCGAIGIFLFEENDLEAHGFSLSDAPDGICVSCAIIGEYGSNNDTLDTSNYTNQERFAVDNASGKTQATLLRFRNLSNEDLESEKMTIGAPTSNESFESRYRIKSLYRSAIGEERYREMDPPYFVGNRRLLYRPPPDDDSITSHGEEDRATFIQYHNDWFICLQYSLKQREIESNKLLSRLGYGLICTFLHKSVELNHIEPIWVFMKRMKVGNVQIQRSLNNWISPVPSHHLSQINSLSQYQPGINTVVSIVSTIFSHAKDIRLSEVEYNELNSESERLMKKLVLKEITIPSKGNDIKRQLLSDYYNSKAKFKQSFSIGGNEIHATGMVEALCVNYAAKKVLGQTKARNLEKKYLFPQGNGQPWWRDELTDEAKHIIDTFERVMIKMDN